MQKAVSGDLIVSSLGSGSNGNSFLIEFGSDRVLIDAGVPIRTLTACLAQRSITPGDLKAALISHEHTDHTRALLQLTKKSPIPLFATHGTFCGMPEVQRCEQHEIRSLSAFKLGDLKITPIPVAHDAREPVGFYIECELASIAIMTDLGEVTEVNAEFASRADHLIIESNYDESVNVAEQVPDSESLLNWVPRLISTRRESHEIGHGDLTILDTNAESVFAHRYDWRNSGVLCVHNLADEPVTVELDLELSPSDWIHLMLGNPRDVLRANGTVEIPLDEYGFAWYHIHSEDVTIGY